MIRTALLTTTAVLVLTIGAHAQQPPATPPAKATQAPATPPLQGPNPPQLVNIRVELTLTEEGDGAATPRTVSLLIADQQQGRVRSASGESQLNVDARPEVVRDGRIRLFLSLEYRPGNETQVVQSLHALLESGTPLVVSQSADPKSDRRVKAEVTATTLK
ncbi:MAG: hypothetical protein H0X67_17655 [Acidobacteria bacterium]|nr:hypothetical protein [Acidobacteriota bacterium]